MPTPEPRHQPTTLYRLYDASDKLLYVGIARSWAYRFTYHSGMSWWADVTTVRLERFASREAAFAAEAQAICDESPLYNVAGSPRATMPRLLMENRRAARVLELPELD